MPDVATLNIPLLNLSDLDDVRLRADFVKNVGMAYKEYGFCSFTGHGLDMDVVSSARSAYERFFAQTLDEKMKSHRPDVGGRRGYTPFGVETAKDAKLPDLKEFYHMGQEQASHTPEMPANIWPIGLPEFKTHSLALYRDFEKAGHRVLRAMALALDLNEDALWTMTVGGNSILRALHYPAIESANPVGVRASPHEDAGLITLLWGASASGLEVLSRSGEWIPVHPGKEAIVVNVGDMLQRLTNHVFPSTTHRVINPEGPQARQPRYSLPFFMDPHPDTILATLPQTITPDNPNRYPEPKRAHDCLMERMREIKLQK